MRMLLCCLTFDVSCGTVDDVHDALRLDVIGCSDSSALLQRPSALVPERETTTTTKGAANGKD
jgi:hypothetical protein